MKTATRRTALCAVVLAVLAAVHFLWKKLRGKVPSPIAMIGLSAVLGILLWSI